VLDDDDLSMIRGARIGFVFQSFNLIAQLNVVENIEIPMYYQGYSEHESAERACELATMVGLGERLKHRPSELSGGMRKRVGLARALAMRPRIVLFDEPTTGLDPVMTEAINQLIVETQRIFNLTCVVISHDIQSVFEIGHRVAMLYEGRIIEYGTPEEVRASRNPVMVQFLAGSIEGPIQIL
jgi:phospholipid/cholesterol/gamma-HCH transport system ATP-binding protein